MPDYIDQLGRTQQGLGRDAAPVQADAAQMRGFDTGNLHAQLGRTDGRYITAGTGSDHYHIILTIGVEQT